MIFSKTPKTSNWIYLFDFWGLLNNESLLIIFSCLFPMMLDPNYIHLFLSYYVYNLLYRFDKSLIEKTRKNMYRSGKHHKLSLN